MRKLKVLHITTHLNIGGITTYVYLLARQMNQEAYDISVLSSGGNSTPRFHQAGIRTFEFPFRTKSELSLKLYLSIPKAIELVKKEQIDLIHAHTRVTQVMSWWIQKFTGVPYISTCHGFYKRRLGRRLFPGWGEYIIAISEPVSDSLIHQFHIPKSQVKTIFNAIDVQNLERCASKKNVQTIQSEWKLQSNVPILGIVARIVQDKGHEYLVRAVASVRNQFPDIKLLIVGEGPFKSKIQKLVSRLNLDENITFIGNLDDITKALSVIDIFILPAIWREGFGLSIVEAMALKKPVIVTNIWALNALVHNRVNGLLIEPRNISELAKAITELIEKKDLREQIGTNAYQMVAKEFSIERMTHEMSHLYQEVIQRHQTI